MRVLLGGGLGQDHLRAVIHGHVFRIIGRNLAPAHVHHHLLPVFPGEGHGADVLALLLDRHASVLSGVGGRPLASCSGGRQNNGADPCQNVFAHGTITLKTG